MDPDRTLNPSSCRVGVDGPSPLHDAATGRRRARRRSTPALLVGLLGASLLATGPAIADPGISTGAHWAASAANPTFQFLDLEAEGGLPGAAFAEVADVLAEDPGAANQDEPEVVVSSFGVISGTEIPDGTIGIYDRRADGTWERIEVVRGTSTATPDHASAGIQFPNDPTFADINGDGRTDVVVPAGFFICPVAGEVCGSLTWWEQPASPTEPWTEHTLVDRDHPLFFHRAVPVDLDGDGRLDLVTTGETAATAEVRMYRGVDTDLRFDPAPIVLGVGGGSLPVVDDVDGDGDLDVASAQFFMPGGSFVWFEQVASSPLAFVRHEMSATEGGSIAIERHPDLGWIGSNHTNTAPVQEHLAATRDPDDTQEDRSASRAPAIPAEGIYLLTPSVDPATGEADHRLPWHSDLISTGIKSRPHARNVQGAPGVFGTGDLDGDGRVDLGVSGDGDRRVFWIHRDASGEWLTTVVDDGMGQAGGGDIVELDADGDGTTERVVLFTSYDAGAVRLYRLATPTG